MKNTGIEYNSTDRTPAVLPEMAELLAPLTQEQLEALDDREEAEQLAAILNGGSAGDGGPTVKMLCDQVALNRRRLKQVMDLDRVLNQRIGRGKSAYQ